MLCKTWWQVLFSNQFSQIILLPISGMLKFIQFLIKLKTFLKDRYWIVRNVLIKISYMNIWQFSYLFTCLKQIYKCQYKPVFIMWNCLLSNMSPSNIIKVTKSIPWHYKECLNDEHICRLLDCWLLKSVQYKLSRQMFSSWQENWCN